MKKHLTRFALVSAAFLFPFAVLAAITPDCGASGQGAYIATNCGLCSFAQLIQNLINFLIGISIPVSAGLFAYAGVLYFSSVENPVQIARAHKIFKSVGTGFVIALAAWLLVQTLINALVARNFFADVGGSWNTLSCVADSQRPRSASVGAWLSNLGITSSNGGLAPGSTPAGGGGGGGINPGSRGNSTCADGNTNCSPQAIQDAASQAGIQMTAAEAKAMSCIAVTELGGQSSGCSATQCCGTYQLNQGNWNDPSNHTGDCSVNTSRDDAACNLQTALIMFRKNGYQPWTGHMPGQSPWNPAAGSCVANFDPNTTRAQGL